MSYKVEPHDNRKYELKNKIIAERQHCNRCGAKFELTFHHIKPLSEGGAKFDVDNIELLCRVCHNNLHDVDKDGNELEERAEKEVRNG